MGLRARAGSLHHTSSGISLPSCPSRLCLEAEEQEVMVSASEDEAAALEEEVKVEDRRRFFRPCRWINHPFIRLRVSAEGAVAVVAP